MQIPSPAYLYPLGHVGDEIGIIVLDTQFKFPSLWYPIAQVVGIGVLCG